MATTTLHLGLYVCCRVTPMLIQWHGEMWLTEKYCKTVGNGICAAPVTAEQVKVAFGLSQETICISTSTCYIRH